MKKVLLTISAFAAITFSANAQLALETFNSGTLPAGWTLINDGNTVSSSFTGSSAIQAALDAAAYTPVEVFTSGDYQMLTTSDFTPSATASRWLITPPFTVSSANTVIQWQDYDLGSGEPITVLVSPTAGTTAGSFTSTVYHAPCGTGGLVTHQVPIGAYNGSTITIAFRDDTTENWGFVVDNVQTAIVDSYDLSVTSLNLLPFTQTGSSNTITGNLSNLGLATITSINLNYSVNGGTPVVTPLSGLSIPLATNYTYTSSTPWVPATSGVYTIKVWADNINGGSIDENPSNDTTTAVISVIDTLQAKQVMIEEFNQASCDPCAEAAPNVDSVYANSSSFTNIVRYHVDFPGRDFMDSVTLDPFVNAMLAYYQVSGVPDAQVDGQYVYPGAGYLTSPLLQEFATAGSPFTITVNPSYNAATQTYSFTANITAHGALPAGLTLRAALAVDTITYAANQSTETIPQYLFPQVAENMFPNASGTTLSAFTSGSTQTVTLSWAKNHPWASHYSSWNYDSTINGQIVVWVEGQLNYDGGAPYVYQSAAATVSTVASTGINAVSVSNGSMELYPNPASKNATIALNLVNATDVKMEVYNMAGQLVYSMPSENRNAGTSLASFDVSNFAAGDYMVTVTLGGQVLNKKLTVTK